MEGLPNRAAFEGAETGEGIFYFPLKLGYRPEVIPDFKLLFCLGKSHAAVFSEQSARNELQFTDISESLRYPFARRDNLFSPQCEGGFGAAFCAATVLASHGAEDDDLAVG